LPKIENLCGVGVGVPEPLLFIEPDGIDAQSGLAHLPDLNPAPGHTFPKYTLEWTPESSSLFILFSHHVKTFLVKLIT
jgi:hypothetical protein